MACWGDVLRWGGLCPWRLMPGGIVRGTTSRGVMSVYRMGEREGREKGGGGKADVN